MHHVSWYFLGCSALVLSMTACGEAGSQPAAASAGADGNGSPVAVVTPPPVAVVAPPKATQSCVAGAFVAGAPDPNDKVNSILPLQFETEHFAFHYQDGTATLAAAQTAGTYLESLWSQFIRTIGFPEPYCGTADKKKTNVFVGVGYGLSGGVDGAGGMGMWMGPNGLSDRFGLAHEFTHALQGSSGSLRNSPYSGWIWESHAEWMALQLPEFHNSIVGCAATSVNNSHLYLGSTRMRYCNWQWMENLKNQFGYGIINDIWRNAPKDGDPAQATGDPFTTLLANKGWSIAQLNDELGRFAMRNVNWDYVNPDGSDQGKTYRTLFGPNETDKGERIHRMTQLDPLDVKLRRFAVEPFQAPQRWGYNLIRVYPDSGATTITADFRGVVQSASATPSLPGLQDEPSTVPAPNSGWRWGLVAINGAGVSRYSALQASTSGTVTMPVSASDQAVYMVVLAAPTVMTQIRWDQPWYSLYRYPWMVQFSNAMPEGFQADAPAPIAGGHTHANGGGWIAEGVTVPSTAYVGPYARVYGGTILGNARIQDHAVVLDGTVQDNAVIGGLTIVRGNTVLKDSAKAFTSFYGLGFFEQNIVLSGNAQNIGDVEQRGASFATGVYYGFVDQAASTKPERGANRTTAVPEVTAVPQYTWY